MEERTKLLKALYSSAAMAAGTSLFDVFYIAIKKLEKKGEGLNAVEVGRAEKKESDRENYISYLHLHRKNFLFKVMTFNEWQKDPTGF